MYTGIGASAGIGIGSAVIVKEPSLAYDNKAVSDVDAEKQRLTVPLTNVSQRHRQWQMT